MKVGIVFDHQVIERSIVEAHLGYTLVVQVVLVCEKSLHVVLLTLPDQVLSDD